MILEKAYILKNSYNAKDVEKLVKFWKRKVLSMKLSIGRTIFYNSLVYIVEVARADNFVLGVTVERECLKPLSIVNMSSIDKYDVKLDAINSDGIHVKLVDVVKEYVDKNRERIECCLKNRSIVAMCKKKS